MIDNLPWFVGAYLLIFLILVIFVLIICGLIRSGVDRFKFVLNTGLSIALSYFIDWAIITYSSRYYHEVYSGSIILKLVMLALLLAFTNLVLGKKRNLLSKINRILLIANLLAFVFVFFVADWGL